MSRHLANPAVALATINEGSPSPNLPLYLKTIFCCCCLESLAGRDLRERHSQVGSLAGAAHRSKTMKQVACLRELDGEQCRLISLCFFPAALTPPLLYDPPISWMAFFCFVFALCLCLFPVYVDPPPLSCSNQPLSSNTRGSALGRLLPRALLLNLFHTLVLPPCDKASDACPPLLLGFAWWQPAAPRHFHCAPTYAYALKGNAWTVLRRRGSSCTLVTRSASSRTHRTATSRKHTLVRCSARACGSPKQAARVCAHGATPAFP